MKNKENLIDILLQDGDDWPDNAKVMLFDLLGNIEVKYSMPCALFGKDGVDYVTKEFFMKAQEQQMNNEKWMPKVGDTCEFRHKSWSTNIWSTAEVTALTRDYLIVGYEYCNSEVHYYLADMKFRPLKSTKELAIEAISKVQTGCDKPLSECLYDAIAAGKVPGVGLVEKKIQNKNRKILVSVNGLFGENKKEDSVAYRVYLNDKCIIADAIFGRSESVYCKKYENEFGSGNLKVIIDEVTTTVEITAEWVD